MANAQGSSFQFAYVPEVTWGTTPATPAMVLLPVTKVSGGLSKSTLEDNTLNSSRIKALSRHGMKTVKLTIEGNLRYGDFDPWIAAACRSTWSTNVTSIGQTTTSFTGEKGFTDIAQYAPYTAVTPTKLSISIKPNTIIPITIECIGKNAAAISTTPLKAVPTAISVNPPFDSFTGSITEGGSAIATVTGIDFSLDNQTAGSEVVFTNTITGITDGKGKVAGTVSAYFTDASLVNKFVNETASSIVVTLTDLLGGSLAINFASLKYMGGDFDVSGDGPITLSLPFEATNVQFTRTAHL
jgi:hypothetical protein